MNCGRTHVGYEYKVPESGTEGNHSYNKNHESLPDNSDLGYLIRSKGQERHRMSRDIVQSLEDGRYELGMSKVWQSVNGVEISVSLPIVQNHTKSHQLLHSLRDFVRIQRGAYKLIPPYKPGK